MRRAGANPTDVEILDLVNKVRILYCHIQVNILTCGVIIAKVEEAGTFNFPEFCYLMNRAVREDAEVGSGCSGGSLGLGGSGGAEGAEGSGGSGG